MPRLLVVLAILLVVVVGALFLLGSLATERPVSRVEAPVELGNLAN